MAGYPEVITEEILLGLADIPDSTIEQDIADTKREIENKQTEREAYLSLAKCVGLPDRRMQQFRADACEAAIAERELFIGYLRSILAARKERNDIE